MQFHSRVLLNIRIEYVYGFTSGNAVSRLGIPFCSSGAIFVDVVESFIEQN